MLSETLISVPHVSHTLNYSAEKPAAERAERRRKGKRKDLRASLVFCSCSTHPPSRLSVPDPVPRGETLYLNPGGVEVLMIPIGEQDHV